MEISPWSQTSLTIDTLRFVSLESIIKWLTKGELSLQSHALQSLNFSIHLRAFAKEDIPAGEVITLYNGYIFDAEQIQIFNNETKKRFDIDNLPKEDPLHWMITKYHGSVPECSATITIPHDLGALFTYRATLGHKVISIHHSDLSSIILYTFS